MVCENPHFGLKPVVKHFITSSLPAQRNSQLDIFVNSKERKTDRGNQAKIVLLKSCKTFVDGKSGIRQTICCYFDSLTNKLCPSARSSERECVSVRGFLQHTHTHTQT